MSEPDLFEQEPEWAAIRQSDTPPPPMPSPAPQPAPPTVRVPAPPEPAPAAEVHVPSAEAPAETAGWEVSWESPAPPPVDAFERRLSSDLFEPRPDDADPFTDEESFSPPPRTVPAEPAPFDPMGAWFASSRRGSFGRGGRAAKQSRNPRAARRHAAPKRQRGAKAKPAAAPDGGATGREQKRSFFTLSLRRKSNAA